LIFVDTSALYALADKADPHHKRAVDLFGQLLSEGEPLLTHNYVLVEATALLQSRLGLPAAISLARSSENFDVVWVDKARHREALDHLERSGKRRVSLVDQVSFLIMRERKVERAFAFDPDFEVEGFRLAGA
jgi:predicted nucleic acid-binding protein